VLGVYENFPENVHKTALFASAISSKRLQQAVTEIFSKLNTASLHLEDVSAPSVPECNVFFEFGIAETQNFTYLDNEEKEKLLKKTREKTLQIMDFLCVIRYYRTQNGKKAPLRFDYYMLRFVFSKGLMEIQVYHERGSMHVSPEELVDLVREKIDETFHKKLLKPVQNQ
jgi:hypothetical protein